MTTSFSCPCRQTNSYVYGFRCGMCGEPCVIAPRPKLRSRTQRRADETATKEREWLVELGVAVVAQAATYAYLRRTTKLSKMQALLGASALVDASTARANTWKIRRSMRV